ncbi:MAG: hypothetical protein AB8F95_06365 [Bacteroidia bacterium]
MKHVILFSELILLLVGGGHEWRVQSSELKVENDWRLQIDDCRLEKTLPDSIAVPEGCSVLALDEEYNLLLLNPEEGLVHKVLAPDYDSIITAGGRGVRTEGLLAPTDLEVQSRQRIFVLDEAQRRAVILSANLRPAEAIDFLESDRGEQGPDFPIDMAVSPAGELYVLDGLNAQIYMYDAYGKQRLAFGGQDYGDGALYTPTAIDIDAKTRQVWVLDTTRKELVVFSRFGEYLFSSPYPSPSDIRSISLSGDWRVLLGPKTLVIQSATATSFKKRLKLEEPWNQSVCMVGDRMYILRGNTVWVETL